MGPLAHLAAVNQLSDRREEEATADELLNGISMVYGLLPLLKDWRPIAHRGLSVRIVFPPPICWEKPVPQFLAHVTLVVRDYDEAIAFFVERLGFELLEDTYQPQQDKRWVVVSPRGAVGCSILLARAATDHQATCIGNQAGGRVFMFLMTDDFWRDYRAFKTRGVQFVRDPKDEPYGTVAVFKDLYGNLWDLIGPGSRL